MTTSAEPTVRGTRTSAKEATTTLIGANGLVHHRGGAAAPAGVAHVVDGWTPLCGDGRVRFVFPGRTIDDVDEACGDCRRASSGSGATSTKARSTTVRAPRQRAAS